MIRLMFVDDDPIVLKGLEQRFKRLSERWEMRFVTSGQEALAELDKQPCDVIVSDVRMPGMDGYELLRNVRELHPHMARLILTGTATHEAQSMIKPVAHQVLSKPCEPDALMRAVERCHALTKRLNVNSVREAIANVKKLPALPKLYFDLVKELENPDGDAGTVGKIIERDVAMTARVLQVANSAYFAPGRRLRNIREAVTFLGILPLRTLTLALEMFRAMSDVATPGFSLQKLQSHSLRVAEIASGLVRDPEERQTAFAAGMLHDIGKMVMAVGMPERYVEMRVRCTVQKDTELAAELAVFGCTHAEIGAHVLSQWGLPTPLVEAVAFHHAPAMLAPARFGAVGAVHVANALAHEEEELLAQKAPEQKEPRHDAEYLRSAGVADNLSAWREKLAELTQAA
jgi:putative nucleotidyltransferase with HDIG domain